MPGFLIGKPGIFLSSRICSASQIMHFNDHFPFLENVFRQSANSIALWQSVPWKLALDTTAGDLPDSGSVRSVAKTQIINKRIMNVARQYHENFGGTGMTEDVQQHIGGTPVSGFCRSALLSLTQLPLSASSYRPRRSIRQCMAFNMGLVTSSA